MEYSVGDRVVYPLHGAGIVEAIEERAVLGQTEMYYVLRLPIGDMRILVPCEQADRARLRPVVEREAVGDLLKHASDATELGDQANWSHRYREHLDKLRSGDALMVAEVVGALARRSQRRTLAAGERKLYEHARRILLSELVLAGDLDPDDAEQLLLGALG